MRNTLMTITALAMVHVAHSALLITSDGAWSTTAANGTSNGGAQTNWNTGASFGSWGGSSYNVNAETQYMDMQATAANAQQAYAAGYTYSYRSSAAAAIAGHANNQVVTLTANGGTVAASRVAGANNTGTYGSLDRNTINGTYAVSAGNAIIGQTVGMRLSSEGIQSRFRADGDSDLSALLTAHANFNGDGSIYSTAFGKDGGGGLIDTDHVLDMTLGNNGGGLEDGYFRINNNETGKNWFSIGSATDTFRSGDTYTIAFDASKPIDQDTGQNELAISLGSFSTNISIGAATASYSFEVDADTAGIAGESLDVLFQSADVTGSGVNQYQVSDLNIAAIPEPATLGLIVLSGAGLIAVRRMFLL